MGSSEINMFEYTKLRNDVDSLYKTVYQGNGTPSLTNQVTKLNERLDSIESALSDKIDNVDSEIAIKFDSITAVVNERFNHISYQIAQEFQRNNIKEAGGHQLRAGLVTAAIASTASFLIFFLSHLFELSTIIKK
jgi:hypothetical protein